MAGEAPAVTCVPPNPVPPEDDLPLRQARSRALARYRTVAAPDGALSSTQKKRSVARMFAMRGRIRPLVSHGPLRHRAVSPAPISPPRQRPFIELLITRIQGAWVVHGLSEAPHPCQVVYHI